jgi:hypothetical protein
MRSECHTSEDPGNLLQENRNSILGAYPFPVLTADGKLDFSPK